MTSRFMRVEQLLRQHFGTDFIALHDESEEHLGHAGAATGASHYHVELARDALHHYGSLIQLHREVYRVLAGFIPTEIHALRITLA